MMKNILIYKGEGANPFGISSLKSSLKQLNLHQYYAITLVDKEHFHTSHWHKDTALVIFPGGRDIPYHQALQGTLNQSIKEYVEHGGKFFGICAGAYYGSALIEFEKGGPLEVIASRELKFFPGIARGPAYGNGKFCYQSEKGAQIAKLNFLLTDPPVVFASYYNGGCAFIEAENHANIQIIAHYADIEGLPPAIIQCHVGNGQALLCGVHPEYSAYHRYAKKYLGESIIPALEAIETERRALFKSLINLLELI